MKIPEKCIECALYQEYKIETELGPKVIDRCLFMKLVIGNNRIYEIKDIEKRDKSCPFNHKEFIDLLEKMKNE